jgi:ABC-2 type transport system ATP-binding protein
MSVEDPPHAIEVRGLSVRRGGHTVIQELDFAIEAGEIVGLLGPSGCGKSTLMRTVVGVQLGVSGTCDVLGLPAGSRALRTRLGYVTQEASVYGDLTIDENLRYFARVLGATGERVDEVIGQIDLAAERGRRVDSLSGGQRNRVSLGVALLGRPDVLVLDEPTVGLDPVLRRDIWAQFHDLAEAGTTLLVSSHVMEEARECDRILLMRDGRLLADGTQAELLRRTGTPDITAAFLALVDAGAAPQGRP